jgi:hypothetical protein
MARPPCISAGGTGTRRAMASQIFAKFQSVSEDFSSMGYDDTKQRLLCDRI